MNIVTRRNVGAFLVGLVFAWLPLTVNAADSGIVGSKVTQAATDPKAHWTPERIKRAFKNSRLPNLSSPPQLQADAPSETVVRISPPSGLGRRATPLLPQLLGRVDTQFACPITRFDTVFDTDNQAFPQKTIGVLFFDDPGIQWFVALRSSTRECSSRLATA